MKRCTGIKKAEVDGCDLVITILAIFMPKQSKDKPGITLRVFMTGMSAFVEGRLISDNILIAQEMFHGLRTNPSCKGKFMAIKTDMSKAYDRVEWSSVELLLRQFGFCDKWVSWIMSCVTSVQYKVLINGQAYGSITPCRGLRQGDPLASYLFILCTEVLIAHFYRAEQRKLITGIKVSTASPAISHLLFADDSLFFCRATKEQCAVVLGIVQKYEWASGQQINFQKSSVQFGHTVDHALREELKGILGITNLGGMGSYLGILESLGGAKTQIFSYVQDRLQSHASGWPARLLSKGGKEVMIKSVATAVPTFVMSCFRLPKKVTRKLTSAISNFGGVRLDNPGVYIGWHGINYARIKVKEGRYYRHSDPLDPIKSYSPSYGWRSIISARSLVNKGLIKRVGSGTSISVWNDPWIPAQSLRPALSTGLPGDPLLSVQNLIDRNSNSWDMAQLTATFLPEDVAIIFAIPLQQPDKPDSLGWHFTKSGKYSVKSGYHILRSHIPATVVPKVIGPDYVPLQAFVWKIRCPPKLRHFMWQVLSGCVAVIANLRKCGISYDPVCGLCGYEEETINHTLFECHPARQVWALSQFPTAQGVFPSTSVLTNLDFLFWRFKDIPSHEIFPWILWYIWKARNDKLFSNLDSNPLALLRLAKDEAQAWFMAQAEAIGLAVDPIFVGQPSGNGGYGVSRPLSSYLCFVDGSWKEKDQFAGRGWFCISPRGDDPTMGAANICRSLSPLHAEIEALIWAMRCMIGADNEYVIFLTDCFDLVKMVSSPAVRFR
ncbi:PREDICTED: uncharacterized protein LOC104748865 [Camelina sativa]|uniref:Uncharacterized protein LOC104748865 n=1 Tax=Camelina sativa TaxID=90675 RepID=A0ABM0WBP5_CAMSA|nr:PREDICTED: uncharacterized protein LOC104748865 [Camelina sativa]